MSHLNAFGNPLTPNPVTNRKSVAEILEDQILRLNARSEAIRRGLIDLEKEKSENHLTCAALKRALDAIKDNTAPQQRMPSQAPAISPEPEEPTGLGGWE